MRKVKENEGGERHKTEAEWIKNKGKRARQRRQNESKGKQSEVSQKVHISTILDWNFMTKMAAIIQSFIN